jgi:Ala-tRNA(Pro) deacylase
MEQQMNRMISEPDMLAFLERAGVDFNRVEHPPVYTCEEARLYRPETPGLETKNLFLRDERHRFYLLMTDCAKRLDLKALGKLAGAPKLQFGTPEQLLDCLGLTPGAVTILGLANDRDDHKVELLVDAEFWPAPSYLCHPLVNTATLAISHAGLMAFLSTTGHTPRVLPFPSR